MRLPSLVLLVLSITVSSSPAPLQAQVWKKIKEKAKEKVEGGSNAVADSAVEKTTGAVVCVITNTECIAAAQQNGQPVTVTDENGNKVSPADSAAAVSGAKGGAAAGDLPPKAFVNYDFVPGDSVIFAEDFSQDVVGDAPQRVIPTDGNVEVAEYRGQRWLRGTTGGHLEIDLPGVLPPRFTFECDLLSMGAWGPSIDFSGGADNHDPVFFTSSAGVGNFASNPIDFGDGHVYHARVMADGNYVKVYVDGKRTANAPRVNIGRSNKILIGYGASDDDPFYMTNIRIAEGGKHILWDALMANGRVATHGILFAVNSDHIRLESMPTIKAIADMMKAHPELKLTIEGHTDNTGNAGANQTLSEKRAASVKAYLVTNFDIDASRLDTKGYGDTKPVASNGTPEGRQQNRRVELVKR